MQKSYSQQEYLAARARLHEFSQRTKGKMVEKESSSPTRREVDSNQRQNVEDGEDGEEEDIPQTANHVMDYRALELEAVKRHKNVEKECSQFEALLVEANEALEVSIRTAGLRKGRENALLDEVRSLVTLRNDFVKASRQAGEASQSSQRVKAEIIAQKQASINQRSVVLDAIKEERKKFDQELELKIQEVNEKWKSLMDNEKIESIKWRKEQEQILLCEIEQEKKKCREVANSRVATIEEKFNERVLQVRRGADARVGAAEEMATYLKEECRKLKEAEAEARHLATSHAGGAALAAAAEERANNLAEMLNAEKRNSMETISKYRAKLEEQTRHNKELSDTLERERKQAKDNEEAASKRFENELVALDARVRKALGAKQTSLDAMRKERDEALQSAAQAQQLLLQIEQGLSGDEPVAPQARGNRQRQRQQPVSQHSQQRGSSHQTSRTPAESYSRP